MKIDLIKFLAVYDSFHAKKPNTYPSRGPLRTGGFTRLIQSINADSTFANEEVDYQQVAYMLATVFHECDKTMCPIEERGHGKGHTYGVPDPITGKTYYGRGYVQLTWKGNYKTMGDALGVDLLHNPTLALDPSIAYKIMSHGMTEGSFTGKCLDDYIIDPDNPDFVNARRIINGTDKASLIAGYAKDFLQMIHSSV